jgi:hypothetical protein
MIDCDGRAPVPLTGHQFTKALQQMKSCFVVHGNETDAVIKRLCLSVFSSCSSFLTLSTAIFESTGAKNSKKMILPPTKSFFLEVI